MSLQAQYFAMSNISCKPVQASGLSYICSHTYICIFFACIQSQYLIYIISFESLFRLCFYHTYIHSIWIYIVSLQAQYFGMNNISCKPFQALCLSYIFQYICI